MATDQSLESVAFPRVSTAASLARRIVVILAVGAWAGCNLGETRTGTDLDTQQQALADSQLADVPPCFRKSEWVLRAGQQPDAEPLPVWRHAAIEELLDLPADSRPGIVSLLENSDPLVKTNVAISLARLGLGDEASVTAALTAAVQTPLEAIPQAQRMPLRRAAAEALGSVAGIESREAASKLLAEFGDHQGENRAKYQSELHAQLLLALQATGAPLSAEQGLAALASPAQAVRLQALRIWPTEVGNALPQQVVDLCEEADPKLRSEAVLLLAKSQHPEALACGRRALGDTELSVRLAAIEALGLLGGDEAAKLLQTLLEKKQSERVRTSAVAALANMGNRQIAFTAVDAEEWQVRRAVAQTLADDPSDGAAEVARRLLDDPSQQVTGELFKSVAQWPLVDSVPLFLEAMGSQQFATRKAATEALSEQWPAARQFSFQAAPAVREEVLADLRTRWKQDAQAATRPEAFPADRPLESTSRPASQDISEEVAHYLKMLDSPHPSAQLRARYCESLAAMGSGLVESMEHYVLRQNGHIADEVYVQVLPKIDATFAALQRLESSDVNERRRAAVSIATLAKSGGLSRLALQRLSQLMIHQDDALVWRSVQEATAAEEDVAVCTMQTVALTHKTAEVRRRACDYFALHPNGAPSEALLAALEDQDTAVVYSALKAAGAQGSVENSLPIVRLTASNDKTIRIAAAVTLVHLGVGEGADALQRLALDADANIRRIAAESMGDTSDERFVSLLISMLDDQLGVRRAALASLTKIVGEDIGRGEDPSAPNTDEQIHRWRKWHLLRDVP